MTTVWPRHDTDTLSLVSVYHWPQQVTRLSSVLRDRNAHCTEDEAMSKDRGVEQGQPGQERNLPHVLTCFSPPSPPTSQTAFRDLLGGHSSDVCREQQCLSSLSLVFGLSSVCLEDDAKLTLLIPYLGFK